MKILLVCLLVYLVACFFGALYVHYRGQTRLRLGRQLTEHSGIFSPFNILFYFFSAVPKDPLLPASTFPELAVLKENWEVIRDEAQDLVKHGHIRSSDRHNDLAFVAFYKRGWRRFYLRWYHDFMPSARELCPRTVELIGGIPNVGAAAFTLLPAGCELGKHRDPFAVAMRYHLGLVTPNSDDCWIKVDGQKHSWRDGEDVVFDETYVHWARNDTDQTRIILFVDIARPVTNRVIAWIGRVFAKYVLSQTRSNNVDDEKVGVLNHLTPLIYKLKNFFTGLKEWNRRIYYAVKSTLMVAVAATMIWWLFN